MDFGGVAELERFLFNLSQKGVRKFIIDMGQVEYINSAALHILTNIQQQTQDLGGDLRLVRLSPVVQRVFNIVGLRQFFRNYSSIETAQIGL